MDFSKLDQKSIKIMVMLMLHLLDAGLTTQEFFAEVTVQQSVKSKTKHQTLDILTAEDFFRVLYERGIRNKDAEHQNLKEFLQLSTSHPHLLVLKSVKRTLEQMAENERFMEAIQEDILKGEEKAREEAELAQEEADEEAALDAIRRGASGPQQIGDEEDYEDDYSEGEGDGKLETVGEGNETNQMTTGEHKPSGILTSA